MAEIRVEKKQAGAIWPWLLGLLAIIAALFFLFVDFDDENRHTSETEIVVEEPNALAVKDDNVGKTNTEGVMTDNGEISKSVAAFAAFVNEPKTEMNLDHDYTRKGLKMLSASLSSMADRYDLDNIQLQNAKKLMMNKVDYLDNDPTDTKHADNILEAFMSATKVMEQIQTKHLPDMRAQVQDVCSQAKEFKADELTLSQKDAVKDFFAQAADTVQKMALALEKDAATG